MAKRLNQLVAQEKSLKSQVENTISDLHHRTEKQELTTGMTKTFKALEEDSEYVFPPESKIVQVNVVDSLKTATKELQKLLDFEATKDLTNTEAKSDVIVDGEVLLEKVPATTLIFLEKQLGLHRVFIQKMTELASDENWEFDTSSGLHKTAVQETIRTAKVQKGLILSPATDKHPAQTQLITEDKIIGHYQTQKFSGAIQPTEKKQLLEKIDKLIVAVKEAREEANLAAVKELRVGEKLLNFLGLQ